MTQKDMLVALGEFKIGDSTEGHYDAWASDYDRDLLERCGYSAHRIAAAALATLEPRRDLAVVDVGCGTGLVGVELASLGFTVIDGLDISAEMLAQANAKGIYRTLTMADMMIDRSNTPSASDVPSHLQYDAAICAGSFAPGHLGPRAIDRIAALTRPGGPIVIVMNAVPFETEPYAQHLEHLVDTGVLVIHRIDTLNYMSAFDRPGKLIVAQRA